MKGSYDDVVKKGQDEVQRGYEPAIKPIGFDISEYDVINDMKTACKGADITYEMQIQFDSEGGSNLVTPMKQIEQWIQNVKCVL